MIWLKMQLIAVQLKNMHLCALFEHTKKRFLSCLFFCREMTPSCHMGVNCDIQFQRVNSVHVNLYLVIMTGEKTTQYLTVF